MKNKKVIRIDAPGDNWPVLDLETIFTAFEDCILVAQVGQDEPEWMALEEEDDDGTACDGKDVRTGPGVSPGSVRPGPRAGHP